MKEGWTYKKLGEVCNYSIGLTYKPVDVCDDGTIVLRSSNIQNEMLDLNDVVRVNCPIKESLFVQKGDILMCSRNGSARLVGKVAMIPETKERMTYGTFMMVIRSEYNPFLLYFFKSDVFRKQIKHGEANMINQITRYMLDDVVVGLPPISDQQRIVERLDAAFENIDKLKANAEKQLAEARTLFQKGLAKAMEPKEGWEEKTMSEITEVKDGTHDSPKYVTEGIPFVTQKNITINGFDLINTKKITVEDHKKFYTRSNVEFGDIIIAMIGANRGMSCIVNTREIFSIKNVGLIKKTDNINMRFLLYYLHSPAANSYVLENSNGGAQEFIGLKGLRNFPIQFPSLAEQQRIVERLDSLSENVRKYEEIQRQIISECDALKQALLRKVFE